MTIHTLWNNEKGSAIILSMVLLMVVTIIGISAINTSTTEVQIYHNEKIYQRNFYQAESAVMEAGQRLNIETNADDVRPASKNWIVGSNVDLETLSVFLVNNANTLLTNNASFSANAEGIVSGGSLDITSDSNMYGFSIYGYSQDNNGNVFIKIGYKKRM